jgi:predicted metal-dependent peptidase
MMDLGAVLKMLSSVGLDPDSRQALLRAARGESSEEIEAAIETLARALGVVDESGDVKEDAVRELVEEVGLEAEELSR